MSKRIAALFAALIAAAAMTLGAFAAAGSCTLVQTSYAKKGENFTVDVVLRGNPGIKSLDCVIRYDYEDLQFVSVSDAGIISGFSHTEIGSTVQLTWIGGRSNTDQNGVVATITFKALTDSEEGSVITNGVNAYDTSGIRAQVDGATAMVYFGEDPNAAVTPPEPEQPEVTEPPVTEPPVSSSEETEQPTASEEETEYVPDETEATEPTTGETEPTEPPTEPTEPPTQPTEPPTEATEPPTEPTTEPTEPPTEPTEPPTQPTEPPTEATEPPTEPSLPMTEPETEPTVITDAFSDVYNDGVDNSAANNGTLLIALIMLALTAVVVVGIEIYKRNR